MIGVTGSSTFNPYWNSVATGTVTVPILQRGKLVAELDRGTLELQASYSSALTAVALSVAQCKLVGIIPFPASRIRRLVFDRN